MALPPITVQLTNFQQIEILRDQIEQFEEELKKTESRIRDLLYEQEKQHYLRTVHAIFQHAPGAQGTEALPEMHGTREALAGALEAMKAVLANLEASSGPLPPRPAPSTPRMQTSMPGRSGIIPQTNPQHLNPSHPSHPSHPAIQNPLRRNRFDAF